MKYFISYVVNYTYQGESAHEFNNCFLELSGPITEEDIENLEKEIESGYKKSYKARVIILNIVNLDLGV